MVRRLHSTIQLLTSPRRSIACALWLCLLLTAPAAPAAELADPLKPLAPFVGKTWRGEFANSTPEKPVIDVARWEVALNGKAVRILHSVNDGEYGGETLIYWNGKHETVSFFYLTTGGFHTEGTLRFDGARFESVETVVGNADGITEVRATGEILPDGRMKSTSRYLQEGKWVDGHAVVYEEAPSAEVIFR